MIRNRWAVGLVAAGASLGLSCAGEEDLVGFEEAIPFPSDLASCFASCEDEIGLVDNVNGYRPVLCVELDDQKGHRVRLTGDVTSARDGFLPTAVVGASNPLELKNGDQVNVRIVILNEFETCESLPRPGACPPPGVMTSTSSMAGACLLEVTYVATFEEERKSLGQAQVTGWSGSCSEALARAARQELCAPCVCEDTCGNGTRDPVEACDDGNSATADGCGDEVPTSTVGTAGCQIEPGYTCLRQTPEGRDTCTNEPPRGSSENFRVTEDTPFEGWYVGLFSDTATRSLETRPDILTYRRVEPGRIGELTLDTPSVGQFRYVPNPNEPNAAATATDTARITARDFAGQEATATLTFTILQANDPPTVVGVPPGADLPPREEFFVAGELGSRTEDEGLLSDVEDLETAREALTATITERPEGDHLEGGERLVLGEGGAFTFDATGISSQQVFEYTYRVTDRPVGEQPALSFERALRISVAPNTPPTLEGARVVGLVVREDTCTFEATPAPQPLREDAGVFELVIEGVSSTSARDADQRRAESVQDFRSITVTSNEDPTAPGVEVPPGDFLYNPVNGTDGAPLFRATRAPGAETWTVRACLRTRPHRWGTQTFAIAVTDRQGLSSTEAATGPTLMGTLTLQPVNDPPTLEIVDPTATPIAWPEDTGQSVQLRAWEGARDDPYEPNPPTLRMTTAMMSPPLIDDVDRIPLTPLASGNGFEGAVRLQAGRDVFGESRLRFVARDAAFAQAEAEVDIQISNVNDPPTFLASAPVPVSEGAASLAIRLTQISAGPNEPERLQVIIAGVSECPASPPSAAGEALCWSPMDDWSFAASNALRAITSAERTSGEASLTLRTVSPDAFTPVAGQSVTITLQDLGTPHVDSEPSTVNVIVTPVNDPPVLQSVSRAGGMDIPDGGSTTLPRDTPTRFDVLASTGAANETQTASLQVAFVSPPIGDCGSASPATVNDWTITQMSTNVDFTPGNTNGTADFTLRAHGSTSARVRVTLTETSPGTACSPPCTLESVSRCFTVEASDD